MRINKENYVQVYLIISLNIVKVTGYEMIIYETIDIPTRGE